MAEIKSTLDIIMEKTRHLVFHNTEEGKQQLERSVRKSQDTYRNNSMTAATWTPCRKSIVKLCGRGWWFLDELDQEHAAGKTATVACQRFKDSDVFHLESSFGIAMVRSFFV